MSLFANLPPRNPHTQAPAPGPPPRIPGLGYILFSNSGIPYDYDRIYPSNRNQTMPTLSETEHDECDVTEEKTSEDPLDDQVRRLRELEAEEARKGEENWVQSGGVLRDAKGQRDWTRTNAIREELKLRKIEAQILQRWNTYEQAWAELSSRLKSATEDFTPQTFLKFNDIPWPLKRVGEQEFQIDDLTTQRVDDFLLESLTVRNVQYTKKDRIRSSLLRWHPDKLGRLLQRVDPKDIETVKKGIGIVVESLQRLNS